MIRLPLVEIYQAPRYDHLLIPEVDTFTDEDARWYDEHGRWNDYKPEYHLQRLLPEIATAIYFTGRVHRPVIELGGRRFAVDILEDSYHEQHEADGKILVLEETDDPLTVPDAPKPEKYWRGHHYWQFFGQPHWIQNEHFPAASDGAPCRHFVSVENGWGDSGNWNILVSLGPDGLPDIAYFEASCC